MCPAVLAGWHLSWHPRLFAHSFRLLSLPSRSVPKGNTQGQQPSTFGERKWLYLSVFTLIFSLIMWQLTFYLLWDAAQGLIGTISPPHTLLSNWPSNCFLFLAPTLSMMRRMLFLFHITANSRPSMFALKTASPDRTHRARAKGKPQILLDNGGQIRSDSQTATHKCMKCFDLQIDCQNFSFLIPICSDNIFHFVIFFFKE